MSPEELAIAVVNKMYDNDPYSQSLGMERMQVGPGECKLKLEITREMANGFGVAHGAITYSLADSALAFASNSRGKKCLSIDTQISHLRPCNEGDILTATAKEISRSRNLGRYEVDVRNQKEEMVAHFRGTVYVKNEEWDLK